MEQETLPVRRLISGLALAAMGGLALVGESSPPTTHSEIQMSVEPSAKPIVAEAVPDTDQLLLRALQHSRASRSRPAVPKVTKPPLPKPTDSVLPSIVDDPDFVRLRYCESTDTPNINTGNGFFGAYQFDQLTWEEYGGRRYAKRADLATLQEQTIIAADLRSARGYQPWPDCSRKLHLVYRRQ
ncbi:MAG: transglycosylase family protein [Patescibacteria group bacterium]|nr:transglycosylase family protein [Patescibacteria group bacterium]